MPVYGKAKVKAAPIALRAVGGVAVTEQKQTC